MKLLMCLVIFFFAAMFFVGAPSRVAARTTIEYFVGDYETAGCPGTFVNGFGCGPTCLAAGLQAGLEAAKESQDEGCGGIQLINSSCTTQPECPLK
jgi:hypothetical protein